jgi:hypothetical protein
VKRGRAAIVIWLEHAALDLRHAGRVFRRNPVFALTPILTLALLPDLPLLPFPPVLLE